jgi:phosphoserine phosphatase
MLKLVEHPAAVNADPILRKYAQGNNWQILDRI